MQSVHDLETINGVNDLIGNLESIYISPHMVSAIDDPLLQRYVGLDSSDEIKIQIDEWLSSFFDKQLRMIDEKKLSAVLLKVLSYTQHTKVCLAKNFSFATSTEVLRHCPILLSISLQAIFHSGTENKIEARF